MNFPIFVLVLVFGLQMWAEEGRAQSRIDLAEKGKAIAQNHCSRCHVVEPAKPFAGISSTPSFKLLVNALKDWEDRFASFYARLPHQSIVRFTDDEIDLSTEELRPPVELDNDDVDAIVAYAATLED